MQPIETITADIRDNQNTSDHTYQSFRVELVDRRDEVALSIRGCTWNLMNIGLSKADNTRKYAKRYNNNPWDHTETPKEYLDRKERQFKKILEIIQADDAPDFFFLQEVDCLTDPNFLPDHDSRKRFWDLKTLFEEKLQSSGWSWISNQNGNKTLITLFNKKTLKPVKRAQVLAQGKGLGFECDFLHIPTQKPVTLTNVHLDYSADYTETLPAYQQQKIQANRFTIIGGDTNHIPGQKIVGLITNGEHATNLGSNSKGEVTNYDQGLIRQLDGVLANPDTNHRVRVTVTKGEVFQWTKSQFTVEEFTPNRTVTSEIGQPYREALEEVPLAQPTKNSDSTNRERFEPVRLEKPMQKSERGNHPIKSFGIFTRKKVQATFLEELDSHLSSVDKFLTWLTDFYCAQHLTQQGKKGLVKKARIEAVVSLIQQNRESYSSVKACLNAKSPEEKTSLSDLMQSHRRMLQFRRCWGWSTIQDNFLNDVESLSEKHSSNGY